MSELSNEAEYNPRVRVPQVQDIMQDWTERAAATRRRHPPIADIRYGAHPRETLDLFRAERARGVLIFLHGGYWRALSKDESSWVAEALLDQGVSVALVNYPLCPDVGLDRIRDAVRGAFLHLYRDVLSDEEKRRIVIGGHSAGGYLAALHLATDWAALGLPSDPIAGIVPISGIFRLAPLIATSMNEAIGLTPESAAALSLDASPPLSRARLAFVVGGDETAAFHDQTNAMARHWAALAPSVTGLVGRHHFDVVDGLAQRGAALNSLVFGMIEG